MGRGDRESIGGRRYSREINSVAGTICDLVAAISDRRLGLVIKSSLDLGEVKLLTHHPLVDVQDVIAGRLEVGRRVVTRGDEDLQGTIGIYDLWGGSFADSTVGVGGDALASNRT